MKAYLKNPTFWKVFIVLACLSILLVKGGDLMVRPENDRQASTTATPEVVNTSVAPDCRFRETRYNGSRN